MDRKTTQEAWDYLVGDMTKAHMDLRLKAAVSQRGWQEAVRIFSKKGVPVSALKVAEVGCGTGTMSLSYCLAGASVTLIDFNEKVLASARGIYEQYGCKASFVRADCLEGPPPELVGSFDLVISIGLAEHFSGESRKRCIEYHKSLAKPGGVIFIEVPNRSNVFYWLTRSLRTITGTWHIKTEIPFCGSELKAIARELGLKDAYVIGGVGMFRDLCDQAHGILSALSDAAPKWLVRSLKRKRMVTEDATTDMRQYCSKAVALVEKDPGKKMANVFTDNFCSSILLFAFKGNR